MNSRLRSITLRGEERDFYKAAGEGVLIFARCRDCSSTSINPRWYCSACGSRNTEQQTSTRRGKVYSLTAIQRTTDPTLTVPYQVAILRLEEGFTMMCRLVGPECEVGDSVRVEFENEDEGLAVPVARKA